MDARIGQLNSGKCYAYINGYDSEPLFGSQHEVEIALGIRKAELPAYVPTNLNVFTVVLTFEYPARDEVEGIHYCGIEAASKSEAIKIVRKIAEYEGHCQTGKGRYWFGAIKQG